MAAENPTAIFGAAAAARAAASAESSGLRRLWADMRIFYIALFASFVSLSHTSRLLSWNQIWPLMYWKADNNIFWSCRAVFFTVTNRECWDRRS